MTEFPVVLVINCGSSSIKFFQSWTPPAATACSTAWPRASTRNGRFSRSTAASRWRWRSAATKAPSQAIAGALAQRDLIDSVALIGHRVAHGGDLFTESVIISEEVINNIRQVSSLAPLHNLRQSQRHCFGAAAVPGGDAGGGL
ncbi:hypothetical protein LNP05_20850 [Klebsiella pneumoniae subsp. pneumoniae]|nr:hypothetical protein [Klebsiella pneumoniae subsp. pneumoniae]